jgi:hypothetical protein
MRQKWLLLLLVAAIMAGIAACGGAAQPETISVVETVIVEKEVEGETVTVVETVVVEKEVQVEVEKVVTVEVPVESEAAVAEAERRKTVIFDIDGGRVADPELWNPFAWFPPGYH